MTSHLWMMSTQSSVNICLLHHQKIKDREIIATKDSRLHLIWIYDWIFIKFLLWYLLFHFFWFKFLLNKKSILRESAQKEQKIFAKIQMSTLNLLRTYYHLIQHESNFQIACRDTELLFFNISWLKFCVFSKDFLKINDDAVFERYHYEEFRLTRLNIYIKILLRKFQYEQIHRQYDVFFAHFYNSLLFIFDILSLILSAMQIELDVETLLIIMQWQSFWHVCWWFIVIMLTCIVFLALSLILLLVDMIVDEWVFALKEWYKKRKFCKWQCDET